MCQWDSLITRFYNAARVISDLPLYRRSGHSTVDREFEITRNAASTTGNDGQIHSARAPRAPISRPIFIFSRQVCVGDRGRRGDLRPANGTENPVVIVVVDFLRRKRRRIFPTRNYDRTSETTEPHMSRRTFENAFYPQQPKGNVH